MRTNNTIWATMKAWVKGDPDSGNREVIELHVFGQDFVRDSPPEIKTIVAFYSKMYITEENEELAKALGDFGTLKEAQDCLLEGKEHYFKDIKKRDYVYGSLEIETEGDVVFVNLSSLIGSYKGTNVFQIHENGDIEFLPPILYPARLGLKGMPKKHPRNQN